MRADTNLLSDIGRLIVRRDAGKHEDNHKKTKGSPKIKRKDETAAKESHHLLKKHGFDIQADKHLVKKGTRNKKVEDKAKGQKVSEVLKAKRVSKQHDKKSKHKTISDDLSKENLVKALIGGEARAKDRKEHTGVPEKAYRELVEFMAWSDQPTIETGSKKSDIAKPQAAEGKEHPRSSNAKQGVRKKLTKKHKRVLAILSKMPQNILRKYFHLKGLDKYWKVMDNIRRKQAAKESAKKKLETHKDEKIVKELKDLAPKKAKTSSRLKHQEKIRLLQKQAKSHQKNSKQTVSSHEIVKDKAAEKTVKDETEEKKEKDKTEEKIEKDKTTEKSEKPLALQSPLSQKEAKNDAKQTEPKTLHATQIETAHLKKEQSHKPTVEQHAKVVATPQKDTLKNPAKEIKSKDVVKVEDQIKKNEAGKSTETSKVAPHIKDSTSLNKALEKPKSPEVKDVSKKEVEKKVGLKPAVAEQAALSKDSKDKAVNTKDKSAQGVKVVKVYDSQLKSSANLQAIKTATTLQATENKDLRTHEIKRAKEKPQVHSESVQQQLKAMAPNITKKVKTVQNSSTVAHQKPKEIPKALAVTEHHEVSAAHAPQKPEVKQQRGSQVKQQSPAASKIDILKEKIQKTNNLKFKVAQALLAHCETQNRLRQVFDEVNSSLKKAASLAKAIGAKFGIKPRDVEKMTSEHTEGAVEQFLNKLF